MIAPALRRRVAPAFVAFALACSGATAAAGASDWVGDGRSRLRLIAGTQATGEPFLRAGVEIKLAPGWKTYWRHPGDSGVAPRFDFSGSANMKSVDIGWPAPLAWRDGAGVSVGYKDGVVFPLRVVAQDPARPVELALAFDYAICEQVCVPVSGRADLTIPSSGGEDAALAAAEARVPKSAAVGAGGGARLAIRAVEREGDWPRPRIVVEVAAPAGASVELFAEGPGPDWALPVPEPAGARGDGVLRFAFTLDGAPPGADPKGAIIRLTAVSGKDAVEAPYRIE